MSSVLLLIVCLYASIINAIPTDCNYEFVDRAGWYAKPPLYVNKLENPVPYVIIHHTYMPPACNRTETCILAMIWMQKLHQESNGWADIGYSFAVGGDGKVYEGRGWSTVGAHAPSYNDKSIGITVIGDWRFKVPPQNQLETVHKLIQCGVKLGKIRPDYELYGHRQVREGTECPGDALFAEIETWPHFKPEPPFVWQPTSTTNSIEK